jgi:ribosomal protein S18 acetylase RimI-like enzyme
MILLQEMTEADFAEYKLFTVEDYAQNIAQNYRTSIEDARTSSANQINGLLSQGLATPQHFLFNIVLAEQKDEQRIGYLWLEVDEQKKRCFIYDIFLYETYRGQGFGKTTLKLLEAKMVEKKIESISLHVFAHNTAARELYSKLGYQFTGFNMQKWLVD